MKTETQENASGSDRLEPLVRSYTCDCCGRVGEWGKGWKVWGSLALREDGKMIVACSESCSCNIDVKHTWLNKYGETIEQSQRRIGNFG